MEQLSEEHRKLLLTKEWLAKSGDSKPYLFKFCSSTIDLTCLVLITDTQSVWVETLNSNQFARRWRECNSVPLESASSQSDEEEWRENTLKTLTAAHTTGGMTEFTFEVVESRYSDFAFELESKAFKWKWETCFVGHKLGSEIISQHLVLPLISVNHLAFASNDPVGEITESELEKAIDKVGRTARRTIDTHIKNALSKPRLASTIRRMTALFNFMPELPPVVSSADTPDLDPPSPPSARLEGNQPKPRSPNLGRRSSPALPPEPMKEQRRASPSPPAQRPRSPDAPAPPKQPIKLESWSLSPDPPRRPKPPKAVPPRSNEQPEASSATESDDEDDKVVRPAVTKGKAAQSKPLDEAESLPEDSASPPTTRSKESGQGNRPRKSSTEPESSPPRPAKKKKPVEAASSDDSEEEGSTSRPAPAKTIAVKRGTRQPIKRGGKRF